MEFIQGDITKQTDIEAIVNAANAQLAPGGGVAGAIHRAAGPRLYEEARALAPIEPGQCVLTKAYNLPNKYVIHCLGPRYGIDAPEAELLAACYRNAVTCANDHGISSVAFPAISTGAFGYPIEEAANIAVQSVREALRSTKSVERVRFVLFSQKDLAVFEEQSITEA